MDQAGGHSTLVHEADQPWPREGLVCVGAHHGVLGPAYVNSSDWAYPKKETKYNDLTSDFNLQ